MAKKTTEKKNIVKTAEAHARFVRISPRKARLVTNLVKNMYALDALVQLRFVSKKASAVIADVIKSAISNGSNNFNLKKESLFIKTITVDGGPKLKRYMPRAQGRASELRKPVSHNNVLLEERAGKAKHSIAGLGFEKKVKEEKPTEAKTSKEELSEEANKPTTRNQVDKGEQDIKKSTVTQKRRLFNRKSGV
ncbi:MAG: 50S ribosomal protein L22 [Candidatus Doudnabacteria bacterium Gr01-1014_77]|uniref:Large ribosomal subunit protein uL22 n=1 Tax=Candidatus Doudnabacteria bacterium Gr01-1014_77 TaxID=2017133 RepID=A0A554JB61_9BACT|nr:MAG: 50S ribosomal protein L22 [Candidatus Doudnabacteria bacterium Gr01-1014_77]